MPVFQSGCTECLIYQQSMRMPVVLHSHQYLVLSVPCYGHLVDVILLSFILIQILEYMLGGS